MTNHPPPGGLTAILDDLPSISAGEVWLTGAGPGSVGNLSLLALRGLCGADVVVHDALVAPEILAMARADARLIDAGKRGGKASASQQDIIDTMIGQARAGHSVVRLKGGDPLIFGRGGEEALALARAGVAHRIVPGLTSGLAGIGAAGIPATIRHCNQAIIMATGHGAARSDGLDWRSLARTGMPLIIYMGMTNLAYIVDQLRAGGLPPDLPAAIVMNADTPDQRVLRTTLECLVSEAQAGAYESPAIVVVGRNAAFDLLEGMHPPEWSDARPG